MRGRLVTMLDEAMGVADVAVDAAQRDLEDVVERIRRLGPDARGKLRAAVEHALVEAEAEWQAFEAREVERNAKIEEWRAKREQAVIHAPDLVPQADERIAALAAPVDEENEYRAHVEDLRRVLALL